MSLGGGKQTLLVTLTRDGPYQPWGIRIAGGADLNAPIVIIRAQVGTPSDGELKRGDVIKKIGAYDARDLRHEDAQNLFQKAGNSISLVVQRDKNAANLRYNSGPVASPIPAAVRTPTTNLSPMSTTPSYLRNPSPAMAATRPDMPVVFPPPLPGEDDAVNGFGLPQTQVQFKPSFQPQPTISPYNEVFNEEEDYCLESQPYRTTPLVLPGAKVKKDVNQTSSYLRHHPNPMFRAPPTHLSTAEFLMKQKVADTVVQRVTGEELSGKKVVHKQFNSPLNLYSDQNIADTIHSQTGMTPNARVSGPALDRRYQGKVSLKKTVSYDPAKSETFKALQEEEFGDVITSVDVPVQPKVYTGANYKKPTSPHPQAHQKTFQKQHHHHRVSPLGHSDDNIQQSGTFKRLMFHVLGDE